MFVAGWEDARFVRLLIKGPLFRSLCEMFDVLQVYKGHSGAVRSVSMEPGIGQLMASGSEDGSVRVWEVATARCLRSFHLQSAVSSVAWCPNSKYSVVAAASGSQLFLLNVGCGDRLIVSATDTAFRRFSDSSGSLLLRF